MPARQQSNHSKNAIMDKTPTGVDMDITSMFFDKSLSPKLIYSFGPENDAGTPDYRCERMNPAAEKWIRDNTGGVGTQSIDAIFESWGVHSNYLNILKTARQEGNCFSALFARGRDRFVVLDAFAMDDDHIGLLIRRNEDVERAFPLNIFLSVSLDILCIIDADGKFVRVNGEFSKILGYEIADIEGMNIIDFIHPEDLPSTLEAVRVLNAGDALPYFINRYRTKSGEYRFLQWKSNPFPPYIIASARDISEAFSLSQSLQKEFTLDALTGAANRKFFEHEATRLVNQYSKRGIMSSLIMADIDHFKRVNDTYGHPVGDLVLKSLVKILSDNCRTADITARVGGEEFAVLLPGTGSTGAFTVAEKMREAVEAFEFESVGHITASFGVAELAPEDDLQRWYTRADTALYLAKNNGRNRTVTTDMLYRSDERIEILPWKSEFESGNDLIDKEHRALILAGKNLLEAFYNGDSEEESRRLQKLFRLLTGHFASEEKILQSAGYLDLVTHREIHKSLLASATFWKSLQKKGRIQSPAFYGFLINKVIGDHLIKDDAKFFPLFRKEGKG